MALTTTTTTTSWARPPAHAQLCRSPAIPKTSLASSTVCCRTNSSYQQANTRLARDDLLGLIETEERGLKTQRQDSKRAQIVKAIEVLGVAGSEQTTTDESLSGTWRMLWTTEKEQLFIVEKLAPLCGTQAGDILQVSPIHPPPSFACTAPISQPCQLQQL